MRKRWKRSFVTALSMALAVGNCVPAMAASTGWRESAAGWQYVNSNGSVQKGWFQDTKGDWYFLDYNTGIMKTGWIKPKDGKWYFMDYHTGAMKTGWIKPADGKWYYLNPNSNGSKGAMMTGWVQTPDKKWYYMDAASGAMQTGTITVNNQVWTLDANGVWDGKAATSVTYVSSSSSRRPSGSGGGSVTTDKGYKIENGNVTITKIDYNKEKLAKETNNNPNNLTIDVTLKDTEEVSVSGLTVKGDLIITDNVGDGTVNLDNVTVLNNTQINGGGANTVWFKNCKLNTVKTGKSSSTTVQPLHVKFDLGTVVESVETGGSKAVVITTVIEIPHIKTTVPIVVKGGGTVKEFVISETVSVVLSNVKITSSFIIENQAKPSIDVIDNASTVAPEGAENATITGTGTVQGYYDVVLNAGDGIWIIEGIDDKGDKISTTETTQRIKADPKESIDNIIKNVKLPTKEGSEFAGWYRTEKFDGEAVDTTQTVATILGDDSAPLNLYAKWTDSTEATDLQLKEITATIASGSAVTLDQSTVNVTDGKAVLNFTAATGSSVTATGPAVLADIKLKATAMDGETSVDGTIAWNSDVDVKTEIKDGGSYKATFTPTSTGTTEIYKPVEITIELVVK